MSILFALIINLSIISILSDIFAPPSKSTKGSFGFLNYDDSRNFLNKVADLAEEEDHHPEIILEWGKVTVIWWSHKINGLHKNDFICASKTDALFENFQQS